MFYVHGGRGRGLSIQGITEFKLKIHYSIWLRHQPLFCFVRVVLISIRMGVSDECNLVTIPQKGSLIKLKHP